jgi:hypothetical protein
VAILQSPLGPKAIIWTVIIGRRAPVYYMFSAPPNSEVLMLEE